MTRGWTWAVLAAVACAVAATGCQRSESTGFSLSSIFDSPSPAPAGTKAEQGESQLALARLVERRGTPERAAKLYRKCLEDNPQDPLPHHRLGVLAAQQGRFAEAEEHFRTARQLGPPSADLLSDIGYAYYLQNRLPEAEEVLAEALALDPRHKATCNNLGLVLGVQGRWQESLAFFRRAGGEAQAHANLAYVFAQQGDLDRAQAAYLHALSLDPRMTIAAKGLVQIAEYRQRQRPGDQPGPMDVQVAQHAPPRPDRTPASAASQSAEYRPPARTAFPDNQVAPTSYDAPSTDHDLHGAARPADWDPADSGIGSSGYRFNGDAPSNPW